MPRRLIGQASVAILVMGMAAAATSGQETPPTVGYSGVSPDAATAQGAYQNFGRPTAPGYRVQSGQERSGWYGNEPRFDGRFNRATPFFPVPRSAVGSPQPIVSTRVDPARSYSRTVREARTASRPSIASVPTPSSTNLRHHSPTVAPWQHAQIGPAESVHARATQRATLPAQSRLARLPSVQSETTAQPQVAHLTKTISEVGRPVDGTWREDVDHIIINIDGRELKLAKTGPPSTRVGAPDPRLTAGGSVHGRLLHKGQAVVNCQVVIVPLTKNFGSYQVDGDGEPLSTLTDERGIYDFENVPKGRYKVFWLPEGSRQWVRRIEFRPDTVVKAGKAAKVKDVRTALRTIN